MSTKSFIINGNFDTRNMRIISWNVNGLRALHKKGGWDWLIGESPDVLCLQETKAHPDQLPEEARTPPGYCSYFNFPKEKKGYSGVAVYTKQEPISVNNSPFNDTEGRILELEFSEFTLLNVYFPNGGGGPERLKYKLNFYKEFLKHIEDLRKKGVSIVFCGDINTAHKEIDLARPKENETNTGFLPKERAWIDKVVRNGYVDTFRYLNPEKTEAYTYWDMKTFARERNVGWRIDYFFVSPDLKESIVSVDINNEIMGSDHCPIGLDLSLH